MPRLLGAGHNNVHTDYVSALVAVCTAYYALQNYITLQEVLADFRRSVREINSKRFS